MIVRYWVAGLAFSLVVGGIFTGTFLYCLRKIMRLPEKPLDKDRPGVLPVPPLLTGTVERLFFTVVIGTTSPVNVTGILSSMFAWMGLKLATNWHRYQDDKSRYYGFSALLAGLVSMLFAYMGGLIVIRVLWSSFIAYF